MNIRAKFMLQEHHQKSYGSKWKGHTFIFQPQYDEKIPEDQRFARATPTGRLEIMVDNPPVVEYWHSQLGKQFYLDFTLAEEPEKLPHP